MFYLHRRANLVCLFHLFKPIKDVIVRYCITQILHRIDDPLRSMACYRPFALFLSFLNHALHELPFRQDKMANSPRLKAIRKYPKSECFYRYSEMITNSILRFKSIRLHLINPVSQFQSTLDLFFRFLPCPLLFVTFFLLYRHLRFICIQEHIIHVHSCPNKLETTTQNMILQSRFNRHHTR